MKTKTRRKVDIKKKYGLDNSYSLVYVGYRDSIEDHKKIEEMVQDGNTDAIFIDSDWISDAEFNSKCEIIEGLKENFPDMSEEDEEAITEYIYEHNDSNPERDLLRNTGSQYFYYSLGFDDDGMEQEGGSPFDQRVEAVIKKLGVDDDAMRKVVRSALNESGYGGSVVILFEDDIEDMLEAGDVIKFYPKSELCIMNRGNGSGYSVALGRELIFQFDRKNLHSDRGAPGYSFTHDVCGMTRGFMDGATIRKKMHGDKVIPVGLNVEEIRKMEREKNLEDKWRKTKVCTPGDMNITRHADTPYRNDYPCGQKCTACGTFWID